MRILVTGATGFAGGWLAEALAARGGDLFGLCRRAVWPDEWAHLAPKVLLRSSDLCDSNAVEAILRDIQPQQIYHLAGYAQVGRSTDEPDAAWSGNLTATRSLYEAAARWGGKPRILFVGSGLIYGEPTVADEAQDETRLLRPNNPYAASKAAADLLSYQTAVNPGLEIVRARPFNHVGPRQGPQFAVANFARQAAAIERGEMPPVLETGNLESRRDLTDVRDTVAAYILLMEKGRPSEAYNVGSGQNVSMQTVLDRLLALGGLQVEVRRRPDLVRPVDQTLARVDAT
ncbi:MAG TPA: GDP-mannose 4,6-dehydratase, partial [Gemmataceae bacterium]|nr:GDP-mannose 4,6-dehydratase [Gemmataceae bacterium]